MKKKIIIILCFVALATSLVCYGILNYSYSKGVRSGKLVKLSKKGVLLKTYEGTLDLGSGDKLTWEFSAHDKNLGKKLSKHSGKFVKLHYRELFFKIFYDTKYDVTSFEVLDDEQSLEYLCQLVSIMRKSKEVVELTRELIQEHNPDLLEIVRKCQ